MGRLASAARGPDAAVVYFEGVDHAGHSFGADSEQYQQAVGHVDELTRHLVKAVAERHEQLGEQWLVAVTTDHGHKPKGVTGKTRWRYVAASWQPTTSVGRFPSRCCVPLPFAATR